MLEASLSHRYVWLYYTIQLRSPAFWQSKPPLRGSMNEIWHSNLGPELFKVSASHNLHSGSVDVTNLDSFIECV